MSWLVFIIIGVIAFIIIAMLLLLKPRETFSPACAVKSRSPSVRPRPVSLSPPPPPKPAPAPKAALRSVSGAGMPVESMIKEFTGCRLELGENACQAAQEKVETFYLEANVPTFPLEGCGSTRCRCKYVRFADRRKTVRRITADRREVLRFDLEKPTDRRSGDSRRTEVSWMN